MLPPRQPGASPGSAPRSHAGAPALSFDAAKARLLAKLEDRFDMSSSKRMPPSLLKQSLRQTAEQLAEIDARGLSKPDRDRLVETVLYEFLGFGPLEELFGDPTVREIMITGPAAVIARRDSTQWVSTSVRFRDEGHVRATLDKMAAHADPVGPVMASVAALDVKLPNGFRVLALTPPDALGLPATAVFVRDRALPPAVAPEPSGSHAGLPVPPKSNSGAAPRGSEPHGPLTRHRNRVLERILTKLASAGVHDLSRFESHELQRIVTAYVNEYKKAEKLYLSDTDTDRLTLEVLTALRQ